MGHLELVLDWSFTELVRRGLVLLLVLVVGRGLRRLTEVELTLACLLLLSTEE